MKVSLVILGEPASKANSRELVTMNRFSPKKGKKIPMAASIKSEKARNYEKAAVIQIPPSARLMLRGDVKVTMTIFYASRLPDLDESVVLDVMQAKYDGTGENRVLVRNGVYLNDRQVKHKDIRWALDPHNPRAEIEVQELAPGLFDELAPPKATPVIRKQRAPPIVVPMNADPF